LCTNGQSKNKALFYLTFSSFPHTVMKFRANVRRKNSLCVAGKPQIMAAADMRHSLAELAAKRVLR
jgi:hypothetical protein